MLKKYAAIITSKGMDAAIPLSNSNLKSLKLELEAKAKQKVEKLYSKYASRIFNVIWEQEEIAQVNDKGYVTLRGYTSLTALNKEIDALYKEATDKVVQAGMDDGAVDPHAYAMFDMRSRFAGDVKLKAIFAIDDEDFEQLKHINAEIAAFYILDGMINDSTKFGRFGEQKKRTVLVMNKMDKNEKSILKKLRREFFDNINNSSEDDDDII